MKQPAPANEFGEPIALECDSIRLEMIYGMIEDYPSLMEPLRAFLRELDDRPASGAHIFHHSASDTGADI